MKRCLCSVPWRSSGGRFGVAGSLRESGQEAPFLIPHGQGNDRSPGRCAPGANHADSPHLPISPTKWRKGQPFAVLTRGPVFLVVHIVLPLAPPPKGEPPLTASFH